MQQVVLRLLHRRPLQAQRPRQLRGLANAVGRPLRGPPVQHLALPHQRVHRAHGLLHRRVGVGTMAVVQVQIVHPQPLQRGMAGVGDVLARQPALGRARRGDRAEIDLAGHTIAIARQPQIGDHVAHHLLGAAVRVDLGVVEEVDPVVPGSGDQVARFVAADLSADVDPGPERQRRQLQAGGAKATVLHANSSCGACRRTWPAGGHTV